MTFRYCFKRALGSPRFWLQVCFGFVLTMFVLAVLLSFLPVLLRFLPCHAAQKREVQLGLFPRVHVPLRERKPADDYTDARPEKAHPNWFACPLSEQQMKSF